MWFTQQKIFRVSLLFTKFLLRAFLFIVYFISTIPSEEKKKPSFHEFYAGEQIPGTTHDYRIVAKINK